MVQTNQREIIKESLSNLGLKRCLLFGSRARGDFSPDSDFDLLIIDETVPPVGRERIRLASRIQTELAFKGVDADVILKTPRETEQLRLVPGSVTRHALLEGIPV